MGNKKKPLKRTANAKVDNVQCLCSCFNLEGNIFKSNVAYVKM